MDAFVPSPEFQENEAAPEAVSVVVSFVQIEVTPEIAIVGNELTTVATGGLIDEQPLASVPLI